MSSSESCESLRQLPVDASITLMRGRADAEFEAAYAAFIIAVGAPMGSGSSSNGSSHTYDYGSDSGSGGN